MFIDLLLFAVDRIVKVSELRLKSLCIINRLFIFTAAAPAVPATAAPAAVEGQVAFLLPLPPLPFFFFSCFLFFFFLQSRDGSVHTREGIKTSCSFFCQHVPPPA